MLRCSSLQRFYQKANKTSPGFFLPALAATWTKMAPAWVTGAFLLLSSSSVFCSTGWGGVGWEMTSPVHPGAPANLNPSVFIYGRCTLAIDGARPLWRASEDLPGLDTRMADVPKPLRLLFFPRQGFLKYSSPVLSLHPSTYRTWFHQMLLRKRSLPPSTFSAFLSEKKMRSRKKASMCFTVSLIIIPRNWKLPWGFYDYEHLTAVVPCCLNNFISNNCTRKTMGYKTVVWKHCTYQNSTICSWKWLPVCLFYFHEYWFFLFLL